ncbi:MAG: hypothetical protein OEV41_06820 [Gammaproteobacteria bacterium]|nr:hypothetical protein [Gammaproteobacteria bacterium]
MSETAIHRTEDQDAPLSAINALSVLDLRALSFTQLRKLHKVLEQASADVAAETASRSDADNSGDTVRVPSPTL